MKTKGIKTILLCVFCAAILTTIPAVPALIEPEGADAELWVARYDGPGTGSDLAYALAVDDSGNVYVTGYSIGSGTYSDYATVKYDSDGNEEWAARYNSPGNYDDHAKALAVDGSGNVYVTGNSFGSETNSDYVTITYTSDGNEASVARYNGPGDGNDVAHALAVDCSGNVYVTGYSAASGAYDEYATIKYSADVIRAQALLAFYDANVVDEDLLGLGPSASSQYRENVIRNFIVNVINCITDGHFEAACKQLQVIYLMIDGEPNPSDFIGGDAVVMEEFRQHVLELLDALS